MSPEAIREAVQSIRKLTDKPFAVNLFIPEKPNQDKDKMHKMNEKLKKYRQELHIDAPEPTYSGGPSFEDQVAVIIEEHIPVFSFTFGIPSHEIMATLKEHEITVIGTATTVREAVVLEESGVDLICGQGSEAGGHRGTFAGSFEGAMVGTMALIPQLVDSVKIPVAAAGGLWTEEALLLRWRLARKVFKWERLFFLPVKAKHIRNTKRLYKQVVTRV